ncbi:MAG: virulence protein RhuM/Fic/DOC family protein [Candidatus Saganbacteria bacterium]|nr:virulence protein RhuM/Fic/DOC family protein [Candidatus Saganbacteria bacterium]
MKKKSVNKAVIYRGPSGALELKADKGHETIWATLNQIAALFETDRSGISRHINNILKTEELKDSTVAKFTTVQKEGGRRVTRQVEYFNLDMILSIGYRVNSKKATIFRQWATKVLREHLLKGFTINKRRIARNYDSFMKAVRHVQALLPTDSKIGTSSILDLIKVFADTWFLLSAYDRGRFSGEKITKKKVVLAASELATGIMELKAELQKKGEASNLFALERKEGSLEGIVGNVMQTFGGRDLYLGVEEKAAHLLYFLVKDHPFVDENKRSGAFAFVWFLRKIGRLNLQKITPMALAVLTLLIAESHPKNKEKMIGLLMLLMGA